ncbi:MAG: hypothetical protein JXX28_10455 [Deltaproteobacteria bacterium]|nr:hypothetical protein [Deltaproteobacteria bacterium]
MRLLSLLTLCSWSGLSLAATVTDLPPGLGGTIDVDYQGSLLFRSLEEAGEVVGRGKVSRHDLLMSAELAPIDGVALLLQFPTTPYWHQSWSAAQEMRYDPAVEGGTYLGGDVLSDPPSLTASGSEGMWLGVAGAPFSEAMYEKSLVSWRFEAATRLTAAKRTLWSEGLDGRGVSPGGHATRLTAAFSTRRGVSDPYLRVQWQREGAVELDLVDATGATLASGVTVRPASRIEALGGAELRIADDGQGNRAVFDLFLGYGYHSWADVPSGIFLPDVLDLSAGKIVTQGEYLSGRAGFALDAVVYDYAHLRLGGEARGVSPHRLETAYPIYTGFDTVEAVWTVSVGGLIH